MILGAVMAGGASSRFGSDKALAVVRGRTLIEHARTALAQVADAVVVVGRGDVADRPRAGLGPLGGIAGALDHGARHGFASVLTIACDMLLVPAALLEALAAEAPSYCADAPVLGHWPTTLAAALAGRLAPHALSSRPCAGIQGSAHPASIAPEPPWTPGPARHDGGIKSGALSVRRWAEAIGAIAIPSPVPLANVNTLADLAAL